MITNVLPPFYGSHYIPWLMCRWGLSKGVVLWLHRWSKTVLTHRAFNHVSLIATVVA